ncbi:MAG: L,D-transpeptidase [Lachnospiraceae bacterium]
MKSKKNFLNYFLIFFGISFFIVFFVYIGGFFYFQNHFLPNTLLNNINISFMKEDDTKVNLEKQYQNYKLTLKDTDETIIGNISVQDIALKVDFSDSINIVLENQTTFLWPISFFSKEENTNVLPDVSYDKEALNILVKSLVVRNSSSKIYPENAYIGNYQSTTKKFEIIPETKGNILEEELVVKTIEEGLSVLKDEISLEECYLVADITAQDLELQEKLNELNKIVQTKITYDWNGEFIVLDGDTISEWIVESEDALFVDTEKIELFVKTNASANDTYGKRRNFTTRMGIELSLPGGAFGWKTDRTSETEALIELINEGSVENREPIYSVKGWKKGKDDIGDSYIEIDLTHQHLYVVENGTVVLETDFVSGDMRKADRITPEGVFGLTYKTLNAVLRGADYSTPVTYWMPFNGNVGMHDATWRSTFGGDIFMTNGSHGCINLPFQMAKQIYEYVSTGSPIICYYYPPGTLQTTPEVNEDIGEQ